MVTLLMLSSLQKSQILNINASSKWAGSGVKPDELFFKVLENEIAAMSRSTMCLFSLHIDAGF
jgi:hypothetical protein